MTWQPIETAPKDGTRVLVFWADGRKCPVDVSWYWDHHDIEYGKVVRTYQRWMSNRYAANGPPPTHWMPLPKPPIE
jgi:hypothetical protein